MHVVATAGHVDHGKSALVRALTGTEPDRLAEERRRGLTIDLGFAWTTLPNAGAVELVDVPGHIRFISNMLAGVAVIEAGLLCVDSREGWQAQTEEHLRILDLIGLPAGLVALTKVGLVGSDHLTEVKEQVAQRIAGTVLADSPVVACDALDGTGLADVRRHLDSILSGRPPMTDQGRPRLWVDRSFTIAGAGAIVTGGIGYGSFALGDHVVVSGAGDSDRRGPRPARVRGMQALGRTADRARPGSRAALNLAGLGRDDVRRGDAVVHPDQWRPSQVVDATLTVLASLDHEVTAKGAYLAYVGTDEQTVRIRLLDGTSLAPGSSGRVRLRLTHALPLVPGDPYVLRDTGRGELVGGGSMVDLDPARGVPVRTPQAVGEIPPEYDWVPATELEERLGIPFEPVVEGWVVSPATLRAARTELLDRLERSRPVGLDVTRLGDRQQGVLRLLEGDRLAETVAGYAVAPAWRDELAGHPFVTRLESEPFSPAPPTPREVPPDVLRALLRRGIVLSRNEIYFSARVRAAAARALADLDRSRPEGFTVSQARQALGTTRKWAVPLMELLDEAGVTERQGDHRHLRT
jgi:selenocysteine-specific elongation factor